MEKKGKRQEAGGISKKGLTAETAKDAEENSNEKAQKGVKCEKRISKSETNLNYRNIKYCLPPRH